MFRSEKCLATQGKRFDSITRSAGGICPSLGVHPAVGESRTLWQCRTSARRLWSLQYSKAQLVIAQRRKHCRLPSADIDIRPFQSDHGRRQERDLGFELLRYDVEVPPGLLTLFGDPPVHFGELLSDLGELLSDVGELLSDPGKLLLDLGKPLLDLGKLLLHLDESTVHLQLELAHPHDAAIVASSSSLRGPFCTRTRCWAAGGFPRRKGQR